MGNAIKKAIEGGYDISWDRLVYEEITDRNNHYLLDPLFWQCLGKQQGWVVSELGEDICFMCGVAKYDRLPDCEYGSKHRYYKRDKWKTEWHNFISHIAVGGSIDDYFNKLLK